MDGWFTFLLLSVLVTASAFALGRSLPLLEDQYARLMVRRKLRGSLPPADYTVLHDVVLDPGDRRLCIDHLILSPYGVFVIASRNGFGSISGSAGESRWRRKILRWQPSFANPLPEVRSQARRLAQRLGLEARHLHPLVVFAGPVRFGSAMPVNVTQTGGLLPFIQVRTRELIDYEELPQLLAKIERQQPAGKRRPGDSGAAPSFSLARRGDRGRRTRSVPGRALSTAGPVVASVALAATAAVVLATGHLVEHFSASAAAAPQAMVTSSPFAEAAPAPRISPPRAGSPRALREQPKAPAPPSQPSADPAVGAGPDARQSLAWEGSLMCAYSTEARRCACLDPGGRKVAMSYRQCKELADESAGPARRSP
jgi:hypothetical protein